MRTGATKAQVEAAAKTRLNSTDPDNWSNSAISERVYFVGIMVSYASYLVPDDARIIALDDLRQLVYLASWADELGGELYDRMNDLIAGDAS